MSTLITLRSKTKDMTKQQADLLQENESLKVELSQLKEKLEQEYITKQRSKYDTETVSKVTH
jgi:regulator of replication initiation timing